jgi:hypothetical protein
VRHFCQNLSAVRHNDKRDVGRNLNLALRNNNPCAAFNSLSDKIMSIGLQALNSDKKRVFAASARIVLDTRDSPRKRVFIAL